MCHLDDGGSFAIQTAHPLCLTSRRAYRDGPNRFSCLVDMLNGKLSLHPKKLTPCAPGNGPSGRSITRPTAVFMHDDMNPRRRVRGPGLHAACPHAAALLASCME